MNAKLRLAAKLSAIAIIVAIDQVVKRLVTADLYPYGTREFIPGIVRLTYVENRGAAFGMLQDARWMFIVLTIVVFAAGIVIAAKGYVKGELGQWAMTFVAAGAFGNFIDRLLKGFVVDMFELQFMNFAIFNVADIFVVIGGIMLLVYMIWFHKWEEKNDSQG